MSFEKHARAILHHITQVNGTLIGANVRGTTHAGINCMNPSSGVSFMIGLRIHTRPTPSKLFVTVEADHTMSWAGTPAFTHHFQVENFRESDNAVHAALDGFAGQDMETLRRFGDMVREIQAKVAE